MVVPYWDEIILVLIESKHANGFNAVRRPSLECRKIRRDFSIASRNSERAVTQVTITALKDNYEIRGKDNYRDVCSLLSENQRVHSAMALQRVIRGFLDRKRTRILQLEQLNQERELISFNTDRN